MNNNFLETNNFKFLINHVFNDIKQKTNQDISNNPKYIRIFKKLVQTIHTQNVNKRVSKEYLNNLVIDKCVPFIIMQLNKEKGRTLNQNPNPQQVNISSRPLSSKQQLPSQPSNNLDFSNLQLGNAPQQMMGQPMMPHNSIIDNIAGISSRNGEKIDYSSRLNEYENERDYDNPMKQQMPLRSVNEMMGKNSNEDIDSVDVMKRMREMENERNYTNAVNDSDNFSNTNNLRNIDNKSALDNINNQSLEIDNKFLQQLYNNNSSAQQPPQPQPQQPPQPQPQQQPQPYPQQQTSEKTNVQLNIVDKSENNKLPEYNSNIENLKSNFDQSKITTEIKEINQDLNQNTSYRYNKIPAQILVIDSINSFNTNDNVDFKVNLVENFVIDKPCDVFIEFINIQGLKSGAGGGEHLETLNCLALQIDEFPVKVASNNENLCNKFIIPNESFGTTDNSADGTIADDDGTKNADNVGNKVNATSYNIRLKSNYFCTIQPQTINELNVKLYGLTGAGAEDSFDLVKGVGDTSRLIIGLFLKKHK